VYKHQCTDNMRKLSETNEFELIKAKIVELYDAHSWREYLCLL